LSACQDGTVKLWDRRATCSSAKPQGGVGSDRHTVAQSKPIQTKSWFRFGNSLTVHSAHQPQSSAMPKTSTWHCISTYLPKCEAVRDLSWNPVIDDRELFYHHFMYPL
jgi:hypothetical protein